MILANRLRMKMPSGCGGDPNCDPYWDNVVLLLHGDGADGSTDIVDSSQSGHAITVNGSAQISTAQSKFGGASAYFGGTGDYLDAGASTDFNFGTDDFTIEMFFYRASASGRMDLCGRYLNLSTGFGISTSVYSAGDVLFYFGTNALCISLGGLWTVGVFNHIAAAKSGQTLRMFINGALAASATTTLSISGGNSLKIGAAGNATQLFLGYIDELRITKGVARYTADFTPPTAPFPNTGP